MKKIVLLLFPALMLPTAVEANWLIEKTLGKYGSYFEASEACSKWDEEGGIFYTWHEAMPSIGLEDRVVERPIRWCTHDEKTRQFLGFEKLNVKEGETYKDYRSVFPKDESNIKIKKRFKY